MTDWFQPYRYIDTALRDEPIFDTLEDLARDIHVWRRANNCRRIQCIDLAEAFDNPEGKRAVVIVGIRPSDHADVIATRSVLTAGEDAQEVRAVIVAAHHANFRTPDAQAAPDRKSLRLAHSEAA